MASTASTSSTGQGHVSAEAAGARPLLQDVDPESVEEFHCPVCGDIFLQEIVQCANGHTICQPCQDKTKKDTCAQCRGQMKSREGQWMRNRALEQILDKTLIACPFRERGCPESVPRGEIPNHKLNCDFGDNVARICHLLYRGEGLPNCHFKINPNQLEAQDIMKHFGMTGIHSLCSRQGHGVFVRSRLDTIIIDFGEFGDGINYPVCVTLAPKLNFLLVVSLERKSDSVTFVALDLNKRTAGEEPVRTHLTLRAQRFQTDGGVLEIKVQVVPLSLAAAALLDKKSGVRVAWSLLRENYTTPGGKLRSWVV